MTAQGSPHAVPHHAASLGTLDRLDTLVADSKATGTAFPHTLLLGAATHDDVARYIAEIVAEDLGVGVHVVACRRLASLGTLLRLLGGNSAGDILYLDGIEDLKPSLRDSLALALRSGAVEYATGTAPSAPIQTVDLAPITVLGASPLHLVVENPLTRLFEEHVDVRTLDERWKQRIMARKARYVAASQPLPNPDDAVAAVKDSSLALLRERGAGVLPGAPVEVRRASYEPRTIVHYTTDGATGGHGPDGAVQPKGLLVLQGATGDVVGHDEEDYVKAHLAALLAHLRAGADVAVGVPDRRVLERALGLIAQRHTRVEHHVERGSLRTKTYGPAQEHLVLRTLLVHVISAESVIRVGGHAFRARWIVAPAAGARPLLVDTDLPERLRLHQACGHLDEGADACAYCGRSFCAQCTPPVHKHYCSQQCYDAKQHAILLDELQNPALRAAIEASGARLTRVVHVDGLSLALTEGTAYLLAGELCEVARAATSAVQVEPAGRWPVRQWRLVADGPNPQTLALCPNRATADRVAAALEGWLRP